MNPQLIEAQIHSFLDQVSNNDSVDVSEDLIEAAGEEFKAALRKQFKPRDPAFRIRMSNIGKPLCQLQMEKSGATPTRHPYNFVVRMLLGDALEAIMRLVIKSAGVNVTSDGDKVELPVAGQTIKGESDIDLDGAVFDIKSTAPWGFDNKWLKGYRAVAEKDDFGYVGQLFGYADAQHKPAGGWIVGNKATGQIAVVAQQATEAETREIRTHRETVVKTLMDDVPFERCFDAEVETYHRKPTGGVKLNPPCSFCDYIGTCWPTARRLPAPASKAQNPPINWYVEYPEPEAE